ncbi:MAG: hypothetical protein JRN62_04140 [Nitrososphaerota archaeon]|jgi:hypothetical protein|nr:hypothetical protein [Nitrososphaerota archaeon]
MIMRTSRRRGIASVLGGLIFLIIMMGALVALAYQSSLQEQTAQVNEQDQMLIYAKGQEAIAFVASGDGTLNILNAGQASSKVVDMLLVTGAGTIYTLGESVTIPSQGIVPVPGMIPSRNCGTQTCLAAYDSILASTSAQVGVAIITSLGNAFWERPAQAVLTHNPLTTYQVTFETINATAAGAATILTVDGTNYKYTQLPITFTWFAGTQHTYAFDDIQSQAPIVSGLSVNPTGTLTADTVGFVSGTYA